MCSLRYLLSLVPSLALLVGSGCDESTNTNTDTDTTATSGEHAHVHDEHKHGPESLKGAIAELDSMRNTIRDAFAKNDQDGAHGPLHEVGHVLEAIPELAKKEKVSADNQAAIEKAVNSLMDAFGRVDKTMHGQEGSTYKEESATIDATLQILSQACGIASSQIESPADNSPANESPVSLGSVEETPAPAADSGDSTDEEKEQ